jgi:hypothetical protein
MGIFLPEPEELPRLHREQVLDNFYFLFDGNMRRAARAAVRRAIKAEAKWLDDKYYAGPPTFGQPFAVLVFLLNEDKAFWFQILSQTDKSLWSFFLECATEAAGSHAFTKEELIPLLQSTAPDVHRLGLKLMAATKNG